MGKCIWMQLGKCMLPGSAQLAIPWLQGLCPRFTVRAVEALEGAF